MGAHAVSKAALAVVPDLMAGARTSVTQAVGIDSKEQLSSVPEILKISLISWVC